MANDLDRTNVKPLSEEQLAGIEETAKEFLECGNIFPEGTGLNNNGILWLLEERRQHHAEIRRLRKVCANAGAISRGLQGHNGPGSLDKSTIEALEAQVEILRDDRSSLAESLRSIQWGSCDDCKHRRYCPECGAQNSRAFDEPNTDGLYEVEDDNAMHKPGCKVGSALGRVAS